MFKCNNCDTEAIIEDLRVQSYGPRDGVRYAHKSSQPKFFLEMLLCDRCKLLYREWQRNHGSTGRRSSLIHNSELLPLSNWFRKQLVKQYAEAKSRLSLARWEIPLSAEHRQTVTAA